MISGNRTLVLSDSPCDEIIQFLWVMFGVMILLVWDGAPIFFASFAVEISLQERIQSVVLYT